MSVYCIVAAKHPLMFDSEETSADILRKRTNISHLGETAVIVGHHGWIWTVQFLNNLKALVELGEDVHH